MIQGMISLPPSHTKIGRTRKGGSGEEGIWKEGITLVDSLYKLMGVEIEGDCEPSPSIRSRMLHEWAWTLLILLNKIVNLLTKM